jgi:hypothetical protein
MITVDIQAKGTCDSAVNPAVPIPSDPSKMITVDSLALPFEGDAFIGMVIDNLTDGSSGVVVGNDEDTIDCVLSGGSLNEWTAGDEFRLGKSPTVGASEVLLSVDQRGDMPVITKYMDFDLSSNVSGTIWSASNQWTGVSDATTWYSVISSSSSYSSDLIDALPAFSAVADGVTFGDVRWTLRITKSI